MKKLTPSLAFADAIATFIGSWPFIIVQTSLIVIWMTCHFLGVFRFDPYPFVFLNLILAFEAGYATPLILMAGNRQSDKDRAQLQQDIKLDEESYQLILGVHKLLKEIKKDIDIDKKTLKEETKILLELAELRKEVAQLKKSRKL
jgi:hypothetical protein